MSDCEKARRPKAETWLTTNGDRRITCSRTEASIHRRSFVLEAVVVRFPHFPAKIGRVRV